MSGGTVNASLVSGLYSPSAIAVSGSNLFVTNETATNDPVGWIGEYTTTGGTVNASLISGLNSPSAIAVSGSNLFVPSMYAGTIGEYTMSGGTVNAVLVSVSNSPYGLAVSGSDLLSRMGTPTRLANTTPQRAQP